MPNAIAGLKPPSVWKLFDGLCQIPRPSKQEDKVIAWVDAWAKDHGFNVRADDFGNRVVQVPASPGLEDAPTVVLQAHLDMVCEKNADSTHDFQTDPIRLERDGDWITAAGTTLGADNGIGVVLAMAAAIDPRLKHGPMELLLTLDEETGLNGAIAFDGSLLDGRLLINLDSEEEGAVYIGCAGACGVQWRMQPEWTRYSGQAHELSVRGLPGGHSGIHIQERRGNAIKVAVRVLLDGLQRGGDMGLVELRGGDKANAIPRESFANLILDANAVACLEQAIAEQQTAWQAHLGEAGNDLQIELRATSETTAEVTTVGTALTHDCRNRWLRLLDSAHHGVLAMSNEVPGLVETSNNVAVVRGDGEALSGLCVFRSSLNTALETTAAGFESLGALAGATAERQRSYPGWAPNPSSPLLARIQTVHKRVLGQPAEVKAVHAGLECGVLVERAPGLDAVSFGPDIRGAHSPDERVSIPSVAKTWKLLRAVIIDLAKKPL